MHIEYIKMSKKALINVLFREKEVTLTVHTAVKVERGSERMNIKAAFLHKQKKIHLRTANSPQIDLNDVMAIKLT